MSAHESFEQLCALAVTGDLNAEELRKLGEHLYECADCRTSYRDFHAIVEQGFPTVLTPDAAAARSLPRLGMKKRFAARAAREGIAMRQTRHHARLWKILVPTAAAALLVIGTVGYGWYIERSVQDRQREAAGKIAVLSGKVAELEGRLREAPAPIAAPAQAQSSSSGREQELLRELSSLRNDYAAVAEDRAQLQSRMADLLTKLQGFREEAQDARGQADRLQHELNDAETSLGRANKDLESLRNLRLTDAATIAQQRMRLDEIAITVREQTDIIARERELLAAGKDIRDLMGARNLRIVDVRDDGTPGEVRPLAGRIFYTQGRSLIFYAYDLQNRGNVSRVDFQVWGKREGRSQQPHSLGILYVDEPSQNRWTLKFENAEVLAAIDQVFVTMEPRGGSERPTGKQLLSAAFLNESPNHP